MTTKTYYYASDGEVFESEEECLQHEEVVKSMDGLIFLDEDFNVLNSADTSGEDDIYNTLNQAMYAVVLDEEKAKAFLKYAEVYCTPILKAEQINGSSWYYYDNDDGEWHSNLHILEKYNAITQSIEKSVEANGK